jgi:hypothetical protein
MLQLLRRAGHRCGRNNGFGLCNMDRRRWDGTGGGGYRFVVGFADILAHFARDQSCTLVRAKNRASLAFANAMLPCVAKTSSTEPSRTPGRNWARELSVLSTCVTSTPTFGRSP